MFLAEDAREGYYFLNIFAADRKCEYVTKDDRCTFCARMGHQCGPKLTRNEYITMNANTIAPDPLRKISSIAMDLEARFPEMEATEIYGLMNQHLRNSDQERIR